MDENCIQQKTACSPVVKLERRVDAHARELVELKRMVEANSEDTRAIREIVEMGRMFFKLLGWLGRIVKPIVVLVAFCAAGYSWLKTGVWK